jgi:hypothetical protein
VTVLAPAVEEERMEERCCISGIAPGVEEEYWRAVLSFR